MCFAVYDSSSTNEKKIATLIVFKTFNDLVIIEKESAQVESKIIAK